MPMNPIIRAQLNDFKKANAGEVQGDSDLFEVMSIFAVENGILGENVDPFRVHLKGKEFGIDGVAALIQGTLCVDADEASSVLSTGKNHVSEFHFYQSKTSDSLDYGDISKFLDAVYDFFTDLKLLSGRQIEDLADVRDFVFKSSAKSNPILKCYYCTTGLSQIPSPIKKLIDGNKERLEALSILMLLVSSVLGQRKSKRVFGRLPIQLRQQSTSPKL